MPHLNAASRRYGIPLDVSCDPRVELASINRNRRCSCYIEGFAFSMQHLNLINGLLVFVVAFIAGVMNAFAGGGTLLTFPTLIWMGLNSIAANATSTVALWPFSVGGTLGYRKELRTLERRWLSLAIPGVIGGLSGAILLRLTPSALFDRLVPYLILFATLLFMAQEPIQRKLKSANPE